MKLGKPLTLLGRFKPQLFSVLLACGSGLLSFPTAGMAQEIPILSAIELPILAADGAREPSLSTLPDGRVLLSWTEPQGNEFAVRTAISDGSEWSKPRTVVQSDNLFVNWADFPSAIGLSDGKLAAHWLEINGDSSYQYDVKIALSDDEGQTWSKPFIPHDDRSQREHGFATLLAGQNGGFTAIWLDGRNYDTYGDQDLADNAMQLRARFFASDGAMGPDELLDVRTCTCCQTSAVVTNKAELLAVYRDRSMAEIRDISIVRKTVDGWSAPKAVADDGWHIEGCPVNGPEIDNVGDLVVVAWFTAADNFPKVHVAFSNDDGEKFGKPIQIDNGAPSGRVDIIQRPNGSALVSWVEQTSQGEAIMICFVEPKLGCPNPINVAVNNRGRSVGFPRMTLGDQGVFIAWAEPSRRPKTHPEGGTTLRTILLNIGGEK